MLSNSKLVQESYTYYGRLIGSPMWSIEFCHFQWPLMTHPHPLHQHSQGDTKSLPSDRDFDQKFSGTIPQLFPSYHESFMMIVATVSQKILITNIHNQNTTEMAITRWANNNNNINNNNNKHRETRRQSVPCTKVSPGGTSWAEVVVWSTVKSLTLAYVVELCAELGPMKHIINSHQSFISLNLDLWNTSSIHTSLSHHRTWTCETITVNMQFLELLGFT